MLSALASLSVAFRLPLISLRNARPVASSEVLEHKSMSADFWRLLEEPPVFFLTVMDLPFVTWLVSLACPTSFVLVEFVARCTLRGLGFGRPASLDSDISTT